MAHVHLTTFNHTDPPHSIVDQIRFLKLLFRYLKIPFSWGPEFRGSALNFVIENIKSAEVNVIREFNRLTGKRIGMIITEHAVVGDQGVNFNTISLSQADAGDDYMEPATARERF